MIRSLTVCVLLTAATVCHGDDKVPRPAKSPNSSTHGGALADASPAELQQLQKLDEATRKVLSKYLSKEFDRYEARIAQLEDQLASQTNSNRQPRHDTPNRYVPSPDTFDTYNQSADSPGEKSSTSSPQPQPNKASPQPTPHRPAQTWQRVNLRGQWYYIVPAEHVDAFVPPQPK